MTRILKLSAGITDNELAVLSNKLEIISETSNQIICFLGYKAVKDKQSHLANAYKNVAKPLIEEIEELTNGTK